MKQAALFLGFIKGPNVKDWVKCWTNWTIAEFTTGRILTDEFYWTEIARGFQNVFQDTGSREHAEDRLRHLAFTPGNVDTFIAQFESLAEEATYPLNTKSTLTLFMSKLPFCMMDHILKVVRPHDFQGWANAARQYHQDNMVVQIIKGIFEDTPKKSTFPQKKPNPTGFTPQQWARILEVKMPLPDPNAMDTRAGRSRANTNRNQCTKGCAGTTDPNEDIKKLRKEGCCFTCNKQGHISRNCPNKAKNETKTPVKARITETEESDEETKSETSEPLDWDAYVCLGRTLKESDKLTIIRKAAEVEQGKEDPDLDF